MKNEHNKFLDSIVEAVLDKEKKVTEVEIEDKILKSPEEVAEARSTLNEEQSTLFDNLIDMVKDTNNDRAVIVGYAGTGKTYAISKFISALKVKCAMTAPTNKAVKVLVDNKTPEMHSVAFSTIHKMLALKMQWVRPKKNENFKAYQKLVRNYKGKVSLNDYKVLIIDECSMLQDDLFHMVMKEKNHSLKVIFLGDPAQIPPIGRLDSIPLLEKKRAEYNIDLFTLEKIMRQADGSNILKTAYSIRSKRFTNEDVIQDRTLGGDVHFMSPANDIHRSVFMNDMLEVFNSDEFNKDPNHCKVIAWRNKTVDLFNMFIRSSIYNIPAEELPPMMVGEKLIADTPIVRRTLDGINIIFNTADEFEVVDYEAKETTYTIPGTKSTNQQIVFSGIDLPKATGKQYHFKYFKAIVKYRVIGEKDEEGNDIFLNERIDIIAPESEQQLSWCISDLAKRKLWDDFEKMIDRFAKVKFNYAITCHKAQGSTYGTVFMIEDDIDVNKELVERNRIKYTAASRASKHLYIISKRNPI